MIRKINLRTILFLIIMAYSAIVNAQEKPCNDSNVRIKYWKDSDVSKNIALQMLLIEENNYKFIEEKENTQIRNIYMSELAKYGELGLKLYILQDSMHYFLSEKHLFVLNSKFQIKYLRKLEEILLPIKGIIKNDIYDMFVLDGNVYLLNFENIYCLDKTLKQVISISLKEIMSFISLNNISKLSKIAVKGTNTDYFYINQGINEYEVTKSELFVEPIVVLDTGLSVIFAGIASIDIGKWYHTPLQYPEKNDSFRRIKRRIKLTWFDYNDSIKFWLHCDFEFKNDKIVDTFIDGIFTRYLTHKIEDTMYNVTHEFSISKSPDMRISFIDLKKDNRAKASFFGFNNDVFKQSYVKMNMIRNGGNSSFEITKFKVPRISNNRVNLENENYTLGKGRFVYFRIKSEIVRDFKGDKCLEIMPYDYVNDHLNGVNGKWPGTYSIYNSVINGVVSKRFTNHQNSSASVYFTCQQYSNDGVLYLINSSDLMVMLMDSNGNTPNNDYEIKLNQMKGDRYRLTMFIESRGLAFSLPIFFYDKKPHSSIKYKSWEAKIKLLGDDSVNLPKVIGAWSNEEDNEKWKRQGSGGYVKDSTYHFLFLPGTYYMVIDAILRYPDVTFINPLTIYDDDRVISNDEFNRTIFNNKYYTIDIRKMYKIKVRKNGRIIIKRIQ